jgi:hypothetical protein
MIELITETDRAYKTLLKEVAHPTKQQCYEALTEDFRERQYNAEIACGSSIELAEAVSGWSPKKKA